MLMGNHKKIEKVCSKLTHVLEKNVSPLSHIYPELPQYLINNKSQIINLQHMAEIYIFLTLMHNEST